MDPEAGIGDSGDLELDLTAVLMAVAEAAQSQGSAIAILIDELQYFSEIEISALIMAIHKANQKQLPLILMGAGLPLLVGLTGRSKSYAERLFDFIRLDSLTHPQSDQALDEPASRSGGHFTSDALSEIYRQTRGYPYFLQEWGYHSWNMATKSEISIDDVKRAETRVIKALDDGFFRVRFDRLTPSEKRYVRAMAELGMLAQKTGQLAEILKVKTQTLAPTRDRLIKKGMIYSPSYGEIAFTVPLFDDFLKREIPKFMTDAQKSP
jgi:hypothetical protein